jgi:hypothetical protein
MPKLSLENKTAIRVPPLGKKNSKNSGLSYPANLAFSNAYYKYEYFYQNCKFFRAFFLTNHSLPINALSATDNLPLNQ